MASYSSVGSEHPVEAVVLHIYTIAVRGSQPFIYSLYV
jgi:hypothetical protein